MVGKSAENFWVGTFKDAREACIHFQTFVGDTEKVVSFIIVGVGINETCSSRLRVPACTVVSTVLYSKKITLVTNIKSHF